MDKNANLSFHLGSGRGFLSDFQSTDLCSVTKVSLNFLSA